MPAVITAACVIIQLGPLRSGQAFVSVELAVPLQTLPLVEPVSRQMLSCVQRGSRDSGMKSAVPGVAELPALGGQLLVQQVRRLPAHEVLRAGCGASPC